MFLLIKNVSLWWIHRSLITTLHQPPSQLLWWDSQWSPCSHTTTPKYPPEPLRSLVYRLVCNKEPLWILSSNTERKCVIMLYLCTLCCSAPSAAASRAGGTERNPRWAHGPQIHLWQPGATLPASSRRPSKSHTLDTVFQLKESRCYYWMKKKIPTTFLFQQTKRKLDDAGKRLGHLYDKLREQSVRSSQCKVQLC